MTPVVCSYYNIIYTNFSTFTFFSSLFIYSNSASMPQCNWDFTLVRKAVTHDVNSDAPKYLYFWLPNTIRPYKYIIYTRYNPTLNNLWSNWKTRTQRKYRIACWFSNLGCIKIHLINMLKTDFLGHTFRDFWVTSFSLGFPNLCFWDSLDWFWL